MPVHQVLALFLFVLALLGGSAPGARAGASPWAESEHVRVRLISAGETAAGPTPRLGLEFQLDGDWKVYWRSPGDAGFPPKVDWSGSSNLASATLSWPVPVRISVAGFETVGYKHEVVLPIDARPERPGAAVALRATVDFLACAEICVPIQSHLALDLPASPGASGPHSATLKRYAALVPDDGARHGLTLEPAVTVNGGPAPVLRVGAQAAAEPFDAPDLFIEGPMELAFGAPRVALHDGGRRATFEVPVDGLADLRRGAVGTDLTLTLVDGERGAERPARIVEAASIGEIRLPAGDPAAGRSLAAILLLALLGGLILNLMPCVLPVLSIKLLGVVSHGGGERGAVRMGFIASAAGILAAFLALAGALIGLKSAGAAIGWGIQFQQTWFLTAMALLVTLFACNLWGLFEIRLPGWLGDLGTGTGQGHGLAGHFLTGAFATLLATPCSAPFLGTAVGFALARGPLEIGAVFAALGLGLSAPYLAVAAFPGLATRLPRPGPWMVVLRKVLGVALAGTAAWLVSVLIGQVGLASAMAIGGLMAGIALLLALRTRFEAARRIASAAAVLLAVAAFLVPARPAGTAVPAPGKDLWQPFDRAGLASLVAAGKVVFVDVTADWCITCQVNKSLVLLQGEPLKRLSGPRVVAMRADWTRPDAAISDYLASFGRYGIPFNAVYGPGLPNGRALPELLSEDDVIRALEEAAGNPDMVSRN